MWQNHNPAFTDFQQWPVVELKREEASDVAYQTKTQFSCSAPQRKLRFSFKKRSLFLWSNSRRCEMNFNRDLSIPISAQHFISLIVRVWREWQTGESKNWRQSTEFQVSRSHRGTKHLLSIKMLSTRGKTHKITPFICILNIIPFLEGIFKNLSLKSKWNECVYERNAHFTKTNRTTSVVQLQILSVSW